MEYICKRCGYTTSQKCHLVRHLKNKKPCSIILRNINIEDLLKELKLPKKPKKWLCEKCGKEFNARSTRYIHQQVCDKDSKQTDEKVSNEELSMAITNLKAEIEDLKSNQQTIINSGIINSGTINSTKNNITVVNVNNFGQENMEYLMKRLEYYWHNKAHGLIEMTKDIHFDPQHPENHTFTITNQRAKTAKILENGEWIPKTYEEAIDDIVYNVSKEIEQFIEEKSDYLKTKFPRIVDLTNKWWDKVGTSKFDEKEYRNLVRSLVEMVINNRHIIKPS